MKFIKILLPIVIVVLVISFAYSFFNISGREIKFIDKLSQAKSVTIIVTNEETNEKEEYELNAMQKERLRKLIEENSYTRRLSSTIVGILPEKRYTIFVNWADGGKKHLQISLLGGEYIQVSGEFGSHYHKIKNPDFEKELISILEAG